MLLSLKRSWLGFQTMGPNKATPMNVKRETLLRLEDTLKRRYRYLLTKRESITATEIIATVHVASKTA
jgi:hypothetical protein